MSSVSEFLSDRRKAELQGIHQFWFPGESMLTTRDELEERITEALSNGLQLQERVARLNRIQTNVLTRLLTRNHYAENSTTLLPALEADGTASFELENALRMLAERGFVSRGRPKGAGRSVGEIVEIPQELGEQLLCVLDVERGHVAPEDQLSQKRLPFDNDFDGESFDHHVARIQDVSLRSLVEIALDRRGVAEVETPGVRDILAATEEPLNRREWREELEASGLGTIGPVSLKDFGILVQEPALIIFQEWIQKRSRELLSRTEDEPDTVLEAGIDLYADIDRLAIRLQERPAPLTRGGRIPKRVLESWRGNLHLPRIEPHLEGDLVEAVVYLAMALGVVETYGDEIRVHEERFRVWRKLDLERQVEMIQSRFLSENQGERWSFHQEALRQILVETLEREKPQSWISLDALVSLVVSTYLLELEERDVRGILRQRREEDFVRERLNSPFARLGTDLTYWIVHRYLLLGVCELGYIDGRLAAFRLTDLGKSVLGIECGSGENRILVNPNFEIILFSEGLRGMRLELELSRFGDRISAERVRRYQVTRDSMRQGVRSGLSLAEIKTILSEASDHPLPEPVLVSLQDWGKDLDWVEVEPSLLLTGLQPERAQALSDFLEDEECPHLHCADGSIVIVRSGLHAAGLRWATIVERLREEGWLIRDVVAAAAAAAPARENLESRRA